MKPGALTALLRQVAAVPEARETEPAPLLPGAVIGRFEIVRELGRGGFGVVYEARDRELGRQVALKLVRPGRAEVEDGKVAREAEAIARLAHPNLITLFDVGRSEHGPYLVFELLRGKTLQERIDEGPMPLQEAVHVAVEVARGLAHAHAEGVVHRDLKPSNVFVTAKGQVKILDFGMAHAFGRRRLSGGTPAYMAPEQWTDEPEDERTDVFALGVMLHVMLSGEYPFPEGDGRWSSGAVTAPKLDVPGAPGLAELVDRMLEKAAKGRPRDGAAVLAALIPIEGALRSGPADGAPPSHAKRRMATFGDLLAELKRRHVFRVMVGYGVFAFAVLQVTEPIMHGAELPDWVLKAMLVALVLGFPVAVVLAWLYDLTAQGVKRTPSPSGPAAPSFGRARFLLPLAVSVAVFAIALVAVGAWNAWKGARGEGQRNAADGRMVVAVADFANGTGEPQLDAMTGLFVTSLEQSKKLVLLTRGRLVDVARQLGLPADRIDEVAGRSAGRRAGAAVLLVPTVHKLGATYVVELRALDLAKDRYRFTVKETATSQDQLVQLLDRLSDRARREMQETTDEVGASRIALGDAVTHSLEAYQHYLRAREIRLRTCDYVASAAEARKALELDPDMGAAHLELAVDLMYVGDAKESERHFQASRDRTARLPYKERRIVEVDTFMTHTVPVDGDKEAQRQTVMRGVDELLASYPQDEYVAYFAGQAHSYFRQWDRALEFYRRSLELDPGQCYVVIHAASVLDRLGRREEVLPLARRSVEARPNGTSLASLSIALLAGAPDEAALRAREAIQAATTGQTHAIINAACALATTGHLEEASSAAHLMAREGPNEATRRWGLRFQAILAAVQGRPREAARLLEPSQHPRPGPPAYLNPRATILAVGRSGNLAPPAVAELRGGPDVLLKAGEFALYGDLTGAAAAAAAQPTGSPEDVHYRAVLPAVEGRWAEALPALRGALSTRKEIDIGKSDPRAAWLIEAQLLLGQALVATGDPAGAVDVLRPIDGITLCDEQAAAQVPGMLVARARAYEKLGRPADALKDLDRLLGLWKNAEPGLPLHAEAKAMRARLAAPGPTESTATPSIAVLSFADMSPGKDQEYLSDGIAEEILNALSHVDGLKVIGRTSSFSFKGKTDDLKSIGEKLGASAVMEGSVRKDGNRIRVTAQVARAADGVQLWSQTFDRSLPGILEVQDVIARAVVQALKVNRVASRATSPQGRPTASDEAYLLLLLSRKALASMTVDGRHQAAKALERAVVLDPGYAAAWAELGRALRMRSEDANSAAELAELRQGAADATGKALALDPNLATAYVQRSQDRAWILDWEGARADADRARSLDPENLAVRGWRAALEDAVGSPAALLPGARVQVEVDPLNAVAWSGLAWALVRNGRFPEARSALRKVLDLAPGSQDNLYILALAHLLGHEPEKALLVAEKMQAESGLRPIAVAMAQQSLGRKVESQTALQELVARWGHNAAYNVAQVYAWRGEPALAFEWLDRALVQRDSAAPWLRNDPFLRSLHADPRWKPLLRKMNLPLD